MVDRGTGRRLDWLEKEADQLDSPKCPKKKSLDPSTECCSFCPVSFASLFATKMAGFGVPFLVSQALFAQRRAVHVPFP